MRSTTVKALLPKLDAGSAAAAAAAAATTHLYSCIADVVAVAAESNYLESVARDFYKLST
jgi:hypothetical protein